MAFQRFGNWDDNNNPIDTFRRSRILAPRDKNRQQIQNATAYQDDLASDEPVANGQFGSMYRPTSENMTAAEQAADESGGLFYNRENMRKFMQAIDENENAPRPAMQALTSHIANQPRREDYEPTKTGKFGAALVGFGTGFAEGPTRGMRAAKEIVDAPYKDARQDWQDRTAPLEYGANIEEKNVKDKTASLTRGMTTGAGYDKFVADKKVKDSENANRESMIQRRGVQNSRDQKEMQHLDSLISNADYAGEQIGSNGNVFIVYKSGKTPKDTGLQSVQYANIKSLIGRRANENANSDARTALQDRSVTNEENRTEETIANNGRAAARGNDATARAVDVQNRLRHNQEQQSLRFLYENGEDALKERIHFDPETNEFYMDAPVRPPNPASPAPFRPAPKPLVPRFRN